MLDFAFQQVSLQVKISDQIQQANKTNSPSKSQENYINCNKCPEFLLYKRKIIQCSLKASVLPTGSETLVIQKFKAYRIQIKRHPSQEHKQVLVLLLFSSEFLHQNLAFVLLSQITHDSEVPIDQQSLMQNSLNVNQYRNNSLLKKKKKNPRKNSQKLNTSNKSQEREFTFL